MNTLSNIDKSSLPQDRLEALGLAGISFLVIAQLLTKETLSTSLWVSLFCLSIAIPFLVAMSFICRVLAETKKHSILNPAATFTCALLGPLFSLIGISAMLWHYSWVLCLVFVVASMIALVLVLYHHVTYLPEKYLAWRNSGNNKMKIDA